MFKYHSNKLLLVLVKFKEAWTTFLLYWKFINHLDCEEKYSIICSNKEAIKTMQDKVFIEYNVITKHKLVDKIQNSLSVQYTL